jgi:tetratricopeptide (TPR) repeat protein/2-polyprenyl-3-methyl-5-hydroxy-6-metoxy-1,4-benzoquinol methylase
LYKAILQTQPKHPDANHNLGIMAMSSNKLEEALLFFKIALESNPKNGQFWISYIETLLQNKQVEIAKQVFDQGKKLGLNGERVDELDSHITSIYLNIQSKKKNGEIETKKSSQLNLLSPHQTKNPSQSEIIDILEKCELEQYDIAKNLAENIVQIYPNHPFGWKVLGTLLLHSGKLKESLYVNEKLLEITPNDPEAHRKLGIALQGLGYLEDAVKSYKSAIAIKLDYAEAHYNLGNTLLELGRLADAEIIYKKAIFLNPNTAENYINLGLTLQELGRLDEAETFYRKAISITPNIAEVHNNLGNMLQKNGRLEDAVISYKKAIAIDSNLAESYSNLSNTLKELGRLEEAFNAAIKSIRIKPTLAAKGLFIDITRRINIKTWHLSLSQLVTCAILEPWGRPSHISPFACRLLKTNNAFIEILDNSKKNINKSSPNEYILNLILNKKFDASLLMNAMLTSMPIPDHQLEIFFTNLRTFFLNVSSSLLLDEFESEEVANLYCSIAQQCFINEYVYFQTTDEINRSTRLRHLLTTALEKGQNFPVTWVIAVACYFPLHSIAGAEKLLQKKYINAINCVLIQQIKEPLEEIKLRRSIPVLTIVESFISVKVQSQYEENPYPRWIRLPKESHKKFLNSYIQNKFPLSSFQRLNDDKSPEILVAGCGTGQHSIGTSTVIVGAKILAVDLSISSLCYAKRKTAELNITSIEYAQADILKLSLLDRTFDLIESSGVLHHLDNPFEGWEALLSLLRPRGLMKIGLYSELARRDIVRVRNLISRECIGSSPREIRDYRKHLLTKENSEEYGFATCSTDFFSTSACRDLLFHIQEHRLNLLSIDKFLRDNNLNFLGFEIDASVIQTYHKRFTNDTAATKLDQWHIYEEENPDTFTGMYQFYVQKNH